MGLADVTLRVSELEAESSYTRRWLDSNAKIVNTMSSLNERISNLEGNSADKFKDDLLLYSSYFGGSGHGFVFFTDPHDMTGFDDYDIRLHFEAIAAVKNNSPASYILCGGDWLNSGHTVNEAKFAVGRVPNLMRSFLGNDSYTVVGNHDLNDEAPKDRSLTVTELNRMWFNKDVGYYYIDYGDTRCYMFDSGSMHLTSMNDYRWEQLDWFCTSLLTCQQPHIFGLIHILNTGSNPAPFGINVTLAIDAYNNRDSITFNGKTYDYSGLASTNRTFHFMLAGHIHLDEIHVINHIPILYTRNGTAFDACYADWDNAVLHTVRTGLTNSGTNRTLAIIPTGGTEAAPQYTVE